MKDLNLFVNELESLIREGKSHLAAKQLRQLDLTKIPRKQRAPIANLCLRTGYPDKSLKLLNRIVRGKGRELLRSTPLEQKEYAAALIALGSALEGQAILNAIDKSEVPDAFLFLAISHFTKWQYSAAIPYLIQFLNHPKISDYQRIVGQVNLASAYIVERNLKEADLILNEVINKISDREEYRLLLGNAYELKVQVSIHRSDFKQADVDIAIATNYQSQHSGISSLFLAKWKALNKALNPEQRSAGIVELLNVAKMAHGRQHWETLREAHYFLSRVLQDDYSFLKVYFGTPHINYRNRMVKEFGAAPAIPNHFVYHFNSSGHDYPIQFDIATGKVLGTQSSIPFASLPHKLTSLLASDFYRPFRLAHIYAELFPSDYFDPFHSPHRIHEIVRRLRWDLEKASIPLSVEQVKGAYRLIARGEISVRVTLQKDVGPKIEQQFRAFASNWEGGRTFDRQTLSESLGLSYRASSRIIRWAIDSKAISPIKNGKRVLYKLLP